MIKHKLFDQQYYDLLRRVGQPKHVAITLAIGFWWLMGAAFVIGFTIVQML